MFKEKEVSHLFLKMLPAEDTFAFSNVNVFDGTITALPKDPLDVPPFLPLMATQLNSVFNVSVDGISKDSEVFFSSFQVLALNAPFCSN